MRKLSINRLKRIFEKISRKYGITYSLVFGSFSRGYTFEESDLDIGVKINRSLNFKEKLELIAKISKEIEKEIGVETDVIILNDAPLGLKYEIFKNGKIIHSQGNEIIEDKSRAIGEYLDFSVWARPIFEKLIEGVRSGRE